MKTWIKGLIIAGSAFAIYKLASAAYELKTFIDQITFQIKAGKPVFSIAGDWNAPIIRIKLNVVFTNPTKTKISFEKPTITVFYDKNTLTQSKIPTGSDKDKLIHILAQDYTLIQNLTFDIPVDANTIMILVDIAKKVTSGLQIKESDSFWTKATAVVNAFASNANKVLELFEVQAVTYFAGHPITYKTKIV